MLLLYNFFIFLYHCLIQIAAFSSNEKAKHWVQGRKNLFNRLSDALQSNERRIWFHCASLGEFEQGRPLIERFRIKYPEIKIVLTFFSPSGYEIRKNYSGADYIFYLPVDTKSNARKFISLVSPEKIFFVKYEYWFHYFNEAGKENIPVFLVSAIFRPGQRFFHWYGGFFRKMLKTVAHFFVQDENSMQLLNSIGLLNVTITGDTRFDRVLEVASKPKSIPLAEKFKGGKNIFIAGSTWEKDEEILVDVFPKLLARGYRIIIAPHEINRKKINQLVGSLQGFKVIKFTEANEETISSFEILIINNIGMLSSLYKSATMAYVGGGFGTGIHNILEAAVFGMPVFFGPEYHRFREANDLVNSGCAFSIKSSEELSLLLKVFLEDQEKLNTASIVTKKYVYDRKGATDKILDFIKAE